MSVSFDLFVVALLPVAALFTVLQKEPYSALISRGVLGVVAVMVYAVLGAPDVALTEALVGTLLTVALFAITVRSTLVMRVGRLKESQDLPPDHPVCSLCARYRLALKYKTYETEKALVNALKGGEIDAMGPSPEALERLAPNPFGDSPGERSFLMLARHCRWHEKKFAMVPEPNYTVIRLTGGGR
jgi:putative multicomponent Na+:H+ antiporter subunit B